MPHPQWQIQPSLSLPDWFVPAVRKHTGDLSGQHLAQLLWQRGIREPAELAGFLNPAFYHPSSPLEFGEEMQWAVERLQQAQQRQEKIAIWGDFDADGITATAVLWEGLTAVFPAEQVTYFIPNRFNESHGLSQLGIDRLADWGCTLMITCDTGSSDADQIAYAAAQGIDVIVTDHHTLPAQRPPVTAIVNPRALSPEHPFATFSGVAVAYKLLEAFYASLATAPSLSALLDLVAIGLIADLVQLTGDCRYLAQRGIEQLQRHASQPIAQSARPGLTKLLDLCKRNGDRPTDISFGLGPRINAISRIHGDARFCVELLTSRDGDRCRQLAEAAELANTRRKSLQKDLVQQVRARLADVDLSTCRVIVLADSQWSVGMLGLVAGQIAQEYGRPTILLNAEEVGPDSDPERSRLARGSARSTNQIDLYQLVQQQVHLLHSVGGHPFALGLSLPVDNLALFATAINQQLRQSPLQTLQPTIQADLTVSVADLGKDLFRELKLLEPCGIGNPAPKLFIPNCWFERVRNRNIQDHRGRKVRYIKTDFELWDDSAPAGFPGTWWEHYQDELPGNRCDAIVELDFNAYKKSYEVRLLSVRAAEQTNPIPVTAPIDWIVDWRAADRSAIDRPEDHPRQALPLRHEQTPIEEPIAPPPCPPALNRDRQIVPITRCPNSWDDMHQWLQRLPGQTIALAYAPPTLNPPIDIWQQLVGMAKYLSRTGTLSTRSHLQAKLGLSDRVLTVGLETLHYLGFDVHSSTTEVRISWTTDTETPIPTNAAIAEFLAMIEEEQFRRRYFFEVPLTTIQAVVSHSSGQQFPEPPMSEHRQPR